MNLVKVDVCEIKVIFFRKQRVLLTCTHYEQSHNSLGTPLCNCLS